MLRSDKKIISVHLPKAGGTSLRNQFERIYKERLFLDYANPPLSTDANIRINRLAHEIDVVYGHFPIRRYDFLGDAFRLTFLRHPVSNIISIYFFWKTLPRSGIPLHDRFLAENPSLLEFAAYGPIASLMSAEYFGSFDMDRMDFVGFHENRDRDIVVLGTVLGVNLSPDLHLNQTKDSIRRDELELNVELRKNVTDLLSKDVEFYEKQWSKWNNI